MAKTSLYPRLTEPLIVEALADSPVVLLHGPRQCGKTTLARMLGDKQGYAYISFDDNISRNAAETDPVGFVDSLPRRTILDEVQRVPALFTTLKAVVDRDRVNGRFLLTGSANVLLVPKLADSLAGRMAIQRLHPLAQCELAGKASRFLDKLFAGDFKHRSLPRLKDDLFVRVAAGGYPAAFARPAGRRRANWYRDYIDTLIQRDVRDMSRISSLDVLPRLLAHAAAHTAQLFNLSELAAPFQLSRPTIGDYVTLLERIFLLERLSPWYSNRASRLVKTPKLHFGDTGLACALLGVGTDALATDRALFGHLLETFVFQELRRQASWHARDHGFFHFRDQNMQEVDIVIERGAHELAGVEVKASATVTASDFSGLRRLRDVAGKRFVVGVVLYDGETCASFGNGLYAVPIRLLWELH